MLIYFSQFLQKPVFGAICVAFGYSAFAERCLEMEEPAVQIEGTSASVAFLVRAP